jgi:hypothetical protein
MSGGAELVAVLAIISSVIAIVDGTKQVFSTARNATGVPEAFEDVACRLPLIRDILVAAGQGLSAENAGDETCKSVMPIIEACERKAKTLDEIFRKVIPHADALRRERYFKAVRALGKGNKVEELMKGILEDIQLLAINRGIKTEHITEAMTALDAIPPSIEEHLLQEADFMNINSGPGSQSNFNAHGDQYSNSGSGKQQVYNAQTMSFGGEH